MNKPVLTADLQNPRSSSLPSGLKHNPATNRSQIALGKKCWSLTPEIRDYPADRRTSSAALASCIPKMISAFSFTNGKAEHGAVLQKATC
jgi:hypothetical protein